MAAVPMIELWRGGMLESFHSGHAVIYHADGVIVEAWGDPDTVIFPRSSCKMVQALPLVESGAADAAGLTERHLALACASHQGAAIHTDLVTSWLASLGLAEPDLRCGSHMPYDEASRNALICSEVAPCQIHNNCSGKHSGFLTLTSHLKAGPEYVALDHPVQRAVHEAVEDMAQETSPGHGIDGCSAPNFATSITGLARSAAFFAGASEAGTVRERAAFRLSRAMMAHPELVAGENRSCTALMRDMGGKVAVKTGAEAVFVAILPEQRLGIALKIADGTTRGSEAALTALLIRLGVLDPASPSAQKYLSGPQKNCNGFNVAELRRAPNFC